MGPQPPRPNGRIDLRHMKPCPSHRSATAPSAGDRTESLFWNPLTVYRNEAGGDALQKLTLLASMTFRRMTSAQGTGRCETEFPRRRNIAARNQVGRFHFVDGRIHSNVRGIAFFLRPSRWGSRWSLYRRAKDWLKCRFAYYPEGVLRVDSGRTSKRAGSVPAL